MASLPGRDNNNPDFLEQQLQDFHLYVESHNCQVPYTENFYDKQPPHPTPEENPSGEARRGAMAPAQAFVSSYAPRLKLYANSLITPVIPPANTLPPSRTTKRGTTAINYADDAYDDDDFDDSEGGRRPTGLRSLRREDLEKKDGPTGPKIGREIHAPVDVQPIFREWMVRRTVKPR